MGTVNASGVGCFNRIILVNPFQGVRHLEVDWHFGA